MWRWIGALICITSFSWGQSGTLSGTIRDKSTGEVLVGATVSDKRSGKGAVSNNFGFFSLRLVTDSSRILVSYVGYQPQSSNLLSRKDTILNFELESIVLESVVIEGQRTDEFVQGAQMSTVSLPAEQIAAVPAFGGETDLLKVVQLLPGVQGGNEAASAIYVRGGGADQNLILFDNVPVYNISHLYGFFSIFNNDAINHIELIKGGFPARYGGRLSSVLDVTSKEGNRQAIHGQASLSLISGKFLVEGPLIKNKTSFLITGRRSYLNLLKSKYFRLPENSKSDQYFFYDFNAKVNHQVNSSNRIYLSFYSGADKADRFTDDSYTDKASDKEVRQETNTRLKWGNLIIAGRWNHIFTPTLFSNFTASYNRYQLNNSDSRIYTTKQLSSGASNQQYFDFNYKSAIRDYGLKGDFEWIPLTAHYFRFGTQWTFHNFAPGVLASHSTVAADVTTDDTTITANELAAYVEDDWKIADALRVNFGLHASSFNVEGHTYSSFQPRLSLRYVPAVGWSIKGSYCTMQQYIHLLTNVGIGLPTDLWVPATANILPQFSRQAALGFSRQLRQGFEFTVETYYKVLSNVIEYKEGASYLETDKDWQSKVESGRGKAYGTEFLLQRKVGRFSGWIGYTLSWSMRQFENINNGSWYPYRYDRRHDGKVVFLYNLGKSLTAGLTWVYSTGNPVTLYVDQFDNALTPGRDGPALYQYYQRNGYRMSNYHRLDLSLDYIIQRKKFDHKIDVSVYNAYSRKNPFYLELAYTPQGRGFRQVSMFPILPSIGYTVSF